jgi:hypothetical protein
MYSTIAEFVSILGHLTLHSLFYDGFGLRAHFVVLPIGFVQWAQRSAHFLLCTYL